jgi:Uma2 family endonuclease
MATATLMTSAEFLARLDEFDERGNRIKEELIGGEIVQMAHTSKRHDITKSNIAEALILHLHAHPGPHLKVLIEAGFVVTEQDTFGPGVAVVRRERLAEEVRLIKGAPEIAIEVVSPTDTVDKIREKIAAYLENGASSVWIFYRDATVAVHTAAGVRELKGGQPLEDPLLPGFAVPVSTFYCLS